MNRPPLRWAYGVTTVPLRINDLLPPTLVSLALAGFDNPRLFVDGEQDPTLHRQRFKLETTVRYPTVRAWGNWYLALWELYLRDPYADYFALFQDDIQLCCNTREYLERSCKLEQAYYNLYTTPENQALAANRKGWYPSNQLGKGALALVFTRLGIHLLFKSGYLVDRPMDQHKGHKSIDGAVVSALKNAQWKEYVHNPSLVQHVGKVSALGNYFLPIATTFPGEEFDAMECVQP